MKLGELKIETLMLIFPSISIDVDTDSEEELREALDTLKNDSNYCDYLSAMTGAINRCFTSLEGKGILPLRAFALSRHEFTERQKMLCVDIKDKLNGKVERLAFRNENESNDNCNFSFEGDNLLIVDDHGEGVYTIVYEPSIQRIKNITGANYKIDLPDNITSLMPYFVKSEVIRTNDSDEASAARSLYEKGIAELVNNRYGYSGGVESIFKM